jgi:hypothetical protein
LEELRSITRLMAALPPKRAPRNFTLQPSMLGMRSVSVVYPRLQLATVLATLAFVITFGVDLLAGGAPLARQASFESQAAMEPAAAPEFAAAPAEDEAPLMADTMVESVATASILNEQTAPAGGGASETTSGQHLEAATEPPVGKEAPQDAVATLAGETAARAVEEAAGPCDRCPSTAATEAPAPGATEPPMLALLAPEAGSLTPESAAIVGQMATEAPVLAEIPPAAPPLPTGTQSKAASTTLPPSPAPTSEGAQLANGLAVSDQGEERLSPTMTPLAQAEFDVAPRSGESPAWLTPLRILQIGLALVTLVLASLTVWARQQR